MTSNRTEIKFNGETFNSLKELFDRYPIHNNKSRVRLIKEGFNTTEKLEKEVARIKKENTKRGIFSFKKINR